jgi:ATP-dependent Clp protease ATP-binding subunit ClpB
MYEEVFETLRRHFRPEFLNRIDEIILFRSLGLEDIRKIVDIQMRRIDRLLEDKKIRLRLSEEARDKIASAGFDPTFGARPLKRALQRLVVDALAQDILQGKIREGMVLDARVDAKDGEKFVFVPAQTT